MMEQPIAFIPRDQLEGDYVIVDVRSDAEVEEHPIANAVHMELSHVPARYKELPQDKLLAFACSGNVRSAQAAAFLQAMGYEKVCVMDVLAA